MAKTIKLTIVLQISLAELVYARSTDNLQIESNVKENITAKLTIPDKSSCGCASPMLVSFMLIYHGYA